MEYFALSMELHQKKVGQTVKLKELSFDLILTGSVFVDVDL